MSAPSPTVRDYYDLAIVGAGVIGLAHAAEAARRGLSVVVIDRSPSAVGASIRNFGFVTVTGQRRGEHWDRARRSADTWRQIARAAGIEVLHDRLIVLARRPEAARVIADFMQTEMAEGCEVLDGSAVLCAYPAMAQAKIESALVSTAELRVDSRTAIPRLAHWLRQSQGVDFLRPAAVRAIDLPTVETTAGTVRAEAAVVCSGDTLDGLYNDRLATHRVSRTKLQMMRIRPKEHWVARAGGWPGAIMSDLGLGRYAGYTDLPGAGALRARLSDEQPEHIEHGVHLIAVQNADGSLVVGDSHTEVDADTPFADAAVDRLILDEYRAATGLGEPDVLERWVGTYAIAPDRLVLVDRPAERVRLAIVTSGTGASVAFAFAREVLDDLYGGGVSQTECAA